MRGYERGKTEWKMSSASKRGIRTQAFTNRDEGQSSIPLTVRRAVPGDLLKSNSPSSCQTKTLAVLVRSGLDKNVKMIMKTRASVRRSGILLWQATTIAALIDRRLNHTLNHIKAAVAKHYETFSESRHDNAEFITADLEVIEPHR